MKSGLRMAARAKRSGPPVVLANQYLGRGNVFNLGVGKQDRETLMRQYGRSGTVYAIVSLLSQAAATTPWHLYRKQPQDGRRRYSTADTGDDQRVEVVQHAALQLLESPNPFQTRFELFEALNQHEELTGECFIVMDIDAGFPTSMWCVRPDRMEPVPSPEDFLVGWMYTGPNGDQVPLKLGEVIQEKLPDPLDPFRGAGPVASIVPNIEQQRYATEYQRNLFLNGADPGGIIQVPNKMTDREFDEFTNRWRESHQGIARAGRVGILENGASWINAAPTNKDMEFANLRLANRDELREAWRMHKSMLGTVEDVNRANAQTAEEVFVAWSEIPRLNRRRETLNSKLLPLFGATGTGVEFDYEDPSPVNQETAALELQGKAKSAQLLVDAGYDPHDVLETVGLPDMNVVEKATQMPALPPSWVGSPAGGSADDDSAALGPQDRLAYTISGKNAAGKVFTQTATDYPPDAMAWMHHMPWAGPVKVPLDHVDPDMPWMDQADPDHVAEFVKQLQDGKKLKPIILVKTPGHSKLELADGHHRYLAYAQLGEPVKAFIGTADKNHGPWEQMHKKQFGRGAGKGGGGDLQQVLLRPFTARALAASSWNRRSDG